MTIDSIPYYILIIIIIYYSNSSGGMHRHSSMPLLSYILSYSMTLGASKKCCYDQLEVAIIINIVVVTRTLILVHAETIESVPAMCVVVKRLML